MDLPAEDPRAGAAEYAAAAVTAFADAGEDLVLVGHSLGGLTIPLIAASRPARQRLLVTDVGGRGMEKGVPEPAIDNLRPDLLAQTAAMTVSPLLLGEPNELCRGRQRVDQGLAAAAVKSRARPR